MADDITNIVLLQHIQAMKSNLESQIASVDQKVSSVDQKVASVNQKVDKNTMEMRTGFEEAHQHREALQEDLEATMRMLSKHESKLARLS